MKTAPAQRWTIGSLVLILLSFGLGVPGAAAADLTKFDPGNIISDSVMYTGTDLTAPAVQSFLDSKAPRCVPSAGGIPCLKSFRMTTANKSADDRCDGYVGRSNESAAEIIANVAKSCGISARALIVMLQKEQSLVTASGSNLTARRYEIAMGFGCPDGQPCDQQYYGFFNQVYRAAWQLETYRLYPARYGHRAGVVNNVRYSPDPTCGSSPVLIQNSATAGLYNYTPYQPNAASLAAGAGAGDRCSAYGNRDFYANFVDWFGSPAYAVGGAIGRWYSSGGNSVRLGEPVANEQAVSDGYWQAFLNGDIYLSPRSTWAVLGPIRSNYRTEGGPTGALGWPRAADYCTSARQCHQWFDNGIIYTEWSTGTHSLIGDISTLHYSMGGTTGVLGLPVQGRQSSSGVWVQRFERGRIYSSSAGTAALSGYLNQWYDGPGRAEQLGQPVANESNTSYGVRQQFANGSVHLTSTSATMVLGPLARTYSSLGGDTGMLGRPLSEAACAPTSCVQEFEHGRIYTAHGAGTWAVTAGVSQALDSSGGTAILGFPTAAPTNSLGATVQTFQNGQVYVSAAGTAVLRGYLLRWHGGGANVRGLGAPVANETSTGGGVQQKFARGGAYLTPSGTAFSVLGPLDTTYSLAGGPLGLLGWPVSGEVCDASGCYQQFESGRIYHGASGGVVLRGAMLTTYLRQALATQLGSPISQEQQTRSGVVQRFGSGSLFLLPTSSFGTYGPIDTAYWRDGGFNSPLGEPRSAAVCPTSTWCFQTFGGGTLYTAHGAGTWSVLGPMDAWISARGGITSAGLGFPTGPRQAVGSGFEQPFQGGMLRQDPQGVVTQE